MGTLYLDRFANEFVKCTKTSPEEEIHGIITKILLNTSFLKMSNCEEGFNNFLNQLHQRFFTPQQLAASPLLSELQASFERDFINPATKETNFVMLIRRLKNLKDFLHKRISLTEQRSFLELMSPLLANFNEKGVELPGQFMVSENEPLPQNTIYIQKFEHNLLKGNYTIGGALMSKRITMVCSNQRKYSFSVTQQTNFKDDFAKALSDDRVSQLKLIMNMIFRRHKETMKRGVKFYVPIKALLFRVKLVQDDSHFQSMQEIHDFLF